MPLSPEFVHSRLRKAGEVFRWARAGRFLISGAAISLFFLVSFLLFDAQFHLGAFFRWAGFFLTVAPLVFGFARGLPAWLRPVPELAIARRIETACSGSGNALVNAVQFDRELAQGSLLRAAVFNELKDPFPRVDWTEVFDLALLKKLAISLGMIALVLVLWAVIKPGYFLNSAQRIFLPGSNIAPLTRTKLAELSPGTTGIVHGADVDLVARLGGDIPRTAWVCFRENGSTWQRELMSRRVGEPDFSYRWKDVRQPFDYYVEAGDLRTSPYAISVRPKTAMKRRAALITPPAYSHLRARTVEGFTTLDGILPGSKVGFDFVFNNPVTSITAVDEKNEPVETKKAGEAHWTMSASVTANRTLALAYRDAEGVLNTDSLAITTKQQEAPKVIITEPQEGRQLVGSLASSLTVDFTATDEIGLGKVALYRSTDEKQDAELLQNWEAAAGKKAFSASASVDLSKYAKPNDERVTFCLVAQDQNDVTGPGVTISRPLTVYLRDPNKVQGEAADAAAKLEQNLRALVKVQRENLDATRSALDTASASDGATQDLLKRQIAIGDMGRDLTAAAAGIAPEVRETLRSLAQMEMPSAVLSLRNAAGALPIARAPLLGVAAKFESIILARLEGAPSQAEEDAKKGQIQDLLAGVAELLHKEREILHDTPTATALTAEPLSDRQDKLATDSVKVRKDVEKDSQSSSIGDADFRARLAKIGTMFGELRIYEGMLGAAEDISQKRFPSATGREAKVVDGLARMVSLLNQWQLAKAGEKAEEMKKEAEKMKGQLDKLAVIQSAILEKSKELARKDQFSADDKSSADEIKQSKDLMAKVLEQMLTDAHVFPDMNISNELRDELVKIVEDVKQEDLDAIAKNELKPSEVAVQKEDGILKAIEETKKIPEDMEMWLPNVTTTAKTLQENFDKTEIPNLPNLPLPDQFTDLIGELQKEQQDIHDKVQDAASNQIALAAPNGNQVSDGPIPGYSAQGKSGNQRPQDMEQSGRSSGGREGESNGEMVGKVADDLEGTKVHARRTSDPMQSGNVEDPSGKAADAKATGGGKASGFSQREGMDGDAPVRGSNAPRQLTNDALAVQQALLAAKTSKKAAAASLLYLKSDKLTEVSRMMQDSQTALKEGRMQDYEGLHKKIMTQLSDASGEIASGKVLSLATGDSARAEDKQLLGSSEGDAPPPYKDRVADYYRSLTEGK